MGIRPRRSTAAFVPSPLLRLTRTRGCGTTTGVWTCSLNRGKSQDRAIITIDIGTSCLKSALYFVDRIPATLGPVFHHEHDTRFGEKDDKCVTQNVDDWMRGTTAALRYTVETWPDVHLVGISVTGQMQNLIGVGNGRPPLLKQEAILYSDCRAQLEAEAMSERVGFRTSASRMLAKLMLLPSPDVVGDTGGDYHILLGAAEYVTYMLSGARGRWVTDATTVSTTGLSLGPEHREYDIDLLRRAGLDGFEPMLPTILQKTDVVGRLNADVAKEIGRVDLAGIAIVHAGGDAYSATVGAGCDTPRGGTYVYAGTSGWVGRTVPTWDESERPDDGEGSDASRLGHAEDGLANLEAGYVRSVGGSLRTACETLLNCEVGQLDEMCLRSSIGGGGVMYMPYTTERSWGGLLGISSATQREDVARAVVEGVVFSVVEAGWQLQGMEEEGVRWIAGGVSKCSTFVEGVVALLGGGSGVVQVFEGEVGLTGAGIVGARALGCGGERRGGSPVCGRVVKIDDDGVTRQEWRRSLERWRVCLSGRT